MCGEGGEYETLVLDCPLFKSRIVLFVPTPALVCLLALLWCCSCFDLVMVHDDRDETEVVEHSKDPFAPVLYLRVKRWHVEPKH